MGLIGHICRISRMSPIASYCPMIAHQKSLADRSARLFENSPPGSGTKDVPVLRKARNRRRWY
jgi:hypothetical protein